MPEEIEGNETAKQCYGKLEEKRRLFLTRARDCSRYTIPTLIPREGHNESTIYPTPYQSLGARGVNNLAGKMILALLPPNSPFFRLDIDPKVVKQNPNDELLAEIDATLSTIEEMVLRESEIRGVRAHCFEAFKHLIVSGNVLLFLPKKGIRVFPLSQYVVRRDPDGNVLEIVVKEMVAPSALPDEIRQAVLAKAAKNEKVVELYTRVQREKDGRKWSVVQEVKDIEVPGSRGSYPADKSPWLPLRWTKIDGENYGRGHVEEYLGDLVSLEGLAKAIVDFAIAASKVLIFVKPGSTTRLKDVANAVSGAVLSGDAEDITSLKIDKVSDFQAASNTANAIEQRLKEAFLLNSSVQRQAERVTAEEIRYMANELETALGGLYSMLSTEFQLPLVNILLAQMQKNGELPNLPKDVVRPTIVTGIDALGRSADSMKLLSFLDAVNQHLGPQVAQQYVNYNVALQLLQNSMSINSTTLIKSAEQIQDEMQKQQQMQMIQAAAPNAVNAASAHSLQARQAAQQQSQPQAQGNAQ